VKNDQKEELPVLNIERSIPLLLTIAALTVLDLYISYTMLMAKHPFGFIAGIPGLILAFQLLWLSLHPFAVIFEDRFEITQSFIHKKQRYFTDIKEVTVRKGGHFFITFNDDEIEKINLFGMRGSHYQKMTKLLTEKVAANTFS
jgi:hypothetical protein